MNSQNLQSTGGGGQNKNDYQQSINGQNLSAAPTNLQNSSSSVLSGNDKRLSSVGSSQFIPVPKSTSASTTSQLVHKPTDTMPLLLGSLLIIIVLATSFLISNFWTTEPQNHPAKKTTKKRK